MLLARPSLASVYHLTRTPCRPVLVAPFHQAARTMSSNTTAADPSTIDIASSSCEPCRGDSPSIKPEEHPSLLSQISPEWRIEPFQNNTAPALQRDFKFKNFKYAMQFGNTIGEIAETKGIKHHPAIVVEWGKVTCASSSADWQS